MSIPRPLTHSIKKQIKQIRALSRHLFPFRHRHWRDSNHRIGVAFLLTLCSLAGSALARADYYVDQGRLDTNWNCWQIDAAIDRNGIIHLLCDQYYQFDLSGRLLTAESEAQDLLQGSLTYPPALSLDPGGNVHVLLREPAGNHIFDDGQWITYRVRNADGSWRQNNRNYLLGTPEGRNNLLGLVAISENEVYAHHGVDTNTSDVYGNIRFLKLGDDAAENMGEWSGIWRSDLDTRMRSHKGSVYFASANAFLKKAIYFSMADAGDDLLTQLKRNVQLHDAGEDQKRGNPDIAIDQSGSAHLIYGAYQEVYYNRYDANGRKLYENDQRILSELGNWYINFGMASIATSNDGEKILVLGLKANGHKEANDSKIVLTYSLDGGETWSKQIETGQITHGGEGRMRPRMLTHQDSIIILYYDSDDNWLSMATINMNALPGAEPEPDPLDLSAARALLLDD